MVKFFYKGFVMKFLILFVIMFSVLGDSDQKYHEDYVYRKAFSHPTKYVVMLYSYKQAPQNMTNYFDESIKRVKSDIKKIKFYASPDFKKEIGFHKEDGLYLNNKKVCRKNHLELYLGLKTSKKTRWPYCKKARIYYFGSESWGVFFLAEKVTDKYVEVGTGENKYFVKREQIPKVEYIYEPTKEAVKKTITNLKEFEMLRSEICELFKNGTNDQILDYLKKNEIKNNLEKGGVIKRGIKLAERYRKDFIQVCNYGELWVYHQSNNVVKDSLKFYIKSKTKFNDGHQSTIGYFYFYYKKKKGWKLSRMEYPRYTLYDHLLFSPDGNVKYKK
tara:strand:- start:157092 stop:158084 length:993 start_codon:yes stop_codon:yes gene_type:complete